MLNLIKRWQWYDWFMITVRVCWGIIILVLFWEVEESWGFPFWFKAAVALIVTSVPFVVLQFNRQMYILCELLLSGLILFLMNKTQPEVYMYLLPASFMIGYYSPGKTYLWSAPLTVAVFPAWISWNTHDRWEHVVLGVIFNYFVSFGAGYAFQLLIVSNKQGKIIEEQNYILEQNINQIKKVTILEERNRLSRELHDTIGHMLTSMIMGMESLRASMAPGEEKNKLETLLSLARGGFDDIRKHIHELKTEQTDLPLPLLLEDVIHAFSDQTKVEISWKLSGDPYLVSRQSKLTFMRCLQEALTNAVRHGQADLIMVTLSFDKEWIRLRIEDNGRGQEQLQPGFGLSGMKERLEALRGELQVRSHALDGTVVVCTLPNSPAGTKEIIHVVIVDDQPIVLEGLKTLLENEDGIRVAATVENGLDAVAVCERIKPDLVLMDMHMPVMNGITALQKIKAASPGIKVLMMSTFEELDQALEALRNGADGYFLKSVQLQELIETVRLVYSGGTAINRDITAKMLQRIDLTVDSFVLEQRNTEQYPFGLTKREMEILQSLDSGMRYKTLAAKLYLSEGTVRNYISAIYGKLGVNSREDAIEKARAEGLL